jgi:hypothetical protein
MLLASEKVGFGHGADLMALGEYGAGIDAADSGLEPGRRADDDDQAPNSANLCSAELVGEQPVVALSFRQSQFAL